MSSATINPIPPERFAEALQDLPLDALHAKAAELQNSISHLKSSNEQMLPFAEAGDQDCKDAMLENLAVIGRLNERIALIRREVEGRGMPFPGAGTNGEGTNGGRDTLVNGEVPGEASVTTAVFGEVRTPRAPSGRLTDEELRRQLEAQMDDDEEGIHL